MGWIGDEDDRRRREALRDAVLLAVGGVVLCKLLPSRR
jgi:hypothetical protein